MQYTKQFWTKLSKQFNEYIENRAVYDRALQIEHTGFFPRHVGFRGMNHDESSLLDFGTKLIEATAVHFAYVHKYKSLQVYIKSTVHSRDAGTYLEYRKDGVTHNVTLFDRADETPWQIKQALGDDAKVDLFQYYAQDEFKQALTDKGYKILVFFRFNEQISMNLPHMHNIGMHCSYIKVTKQGIELGWNASGTYNSLPNVVRVSRVKNIKAVRLHDLGIENKGYYSHDSRCYIPARQAKAAKAFFQRRFKKT